MPTPRSVGLMQTSVEVNSDLYQSCAGIANPVHTHDEGLTSDWEVETDEHEEDAFGSDMSATVKESKSVEEHAGDGAPSDGREVLRSGVAELLALQELYVQAASSSDADPARLANAYMASLRDNSSFHVSIANQVVSASDKKAEYGISSLFYGHSQGPIE
ncbi:unnamed protein product [Phytophthora fragariaefolia]|uniref:Unnamed protein product n=1 Tax=Phytophthora fragariaefolia TaxID=1490495 RepID=A0A9W6XXI1_9STRA|nr:unnamed protein product [Phytophthora fragariaefolia]